MDTLRSVAHLQREIGDDLFAVIASSDNTRAVRALALLVAIGGSGEHLLGSLMIGGEPYRFNLIDRGDSRLIMVPPADFSDAAHQAREACERSGKHLLNHQAEIPAVFRGKVAFVLPGWHSYGIEAGVPPNVACIVWDGDLSRWMLGWPSVRDLDWWGKSVIYAVIVK
jgi:hypothetical protein